MHEYFHYGDIIFYKIVDIVCQFDIIIMYSKTIRSGAFRDGDKNASNVKSYGQLF